MATVLGTAGNDVLVGTSEADIIYGYEGDDLIDGGLGADEIYGGSGNDTIRFTSVRISFPAPTAVGLIDGGEGFDVIDATGVQPTILGTIQNDLGAFVSGLFVGNQRYEIRNVEALYLGSGDDSFSTAAGSPGIIDTGAGSDIGTASGAVQLYLGSGNDRVFISGSFGGPAIRGHIDGGGGIDTLQFNNNFTVDLATATATAGNTTYTIADFEQYSLFAANGRTTVFYGNAGSENVTVNPLFNDGSIGVTYDGRSGDDRITGSNGNDTLIGGDGNDYLDGSAGNDRISGGHGRNVVMGGDGIDTVIFSARLDAATWTQADGKTYVMMPHEITEISGVEILNFSDGKAVDFNNIARDVHQFNSLEYIASYSDLTAYFRNDANAAKSHYIETGYAEGRSVSFNALDYIASYGDLISAVGSDVDGGAAHYINFGSAEGRSVSFDPLSYVASYSDLISAIGVDASSAAKHYIDLGFEEGRTADFSALAYVASYSDLIGAFGTDANAALVHYINSGHSEGRTVSFDVSRYIASYSDLAALFANDPEGALRHYIQHGFAEGRTVQSNPSTEADFMSEGVETFYFSDDYNFLPSEDAVDYLTILKLDDRGLSNHIGVVESRHSDHNQYLDDGSHGANLLSYQLDSDHISNWQNGSLWII